MSEYIIAKKERKHMKNKECKFIKENGRWRVDGKIYFGDGTYAHCNRRWFATKADAKAFFDDWETKAFGEHDQTEDMAFNKLYDRWEQKRLQEVRDTTFSSCDLPVVRSIFKPFFFGKTVREAFSVHNLEALVTNLKGKPFKNAQKNKYLKLVKNIVEYAYMLDIINDKQHQQALIRLQPLRTESAPATEIESRKPWSVEEESAFLSTFEEGSFDRMMMAFFLHAGMRIGEFLALKVKDFSLDKGYVSVSHQIVYKGTGKEEDTEILKSSCSYRKVPMFDEDIANVSMLISSLGLRPDDRVFPVARSTFRRKWDSACEKSGVRKMVPHGVRHMIATRMMGNCGSISDQIALAKILGHTPSIDIDVYANHEDIERAKKIYRS